MSESPRASDEAFAAGLREAIAARGLSLERLRAHLAQRGHHVSVATLSYWQTARSRPDRAASLAALSSLEDILNVERGALSSLLPPKRRRGHQPYLPPADPRHAQAGYGDALAAAARRLGLSWDDGLTRISVHDVVDVRDAGYAKRVTTRKLVVAQESTVERLPIWFQRDDLHATYAVAARRNCTVSQVISVEGAPVVVAGLTLARPLPPGQAMTIEYVTEFTDCARPVTQHLHSCRGPVRELHLKIGFAAQTLPRSAEQFVVVGERRRTSPLLLKGPTLDVRHSEFGPGLAGIEWVW